MMIKLSHIAVTLRCCCAALLCAVVVDTASVRAQETAPVAAAASSNPAVATDGATLIHGNYCGAGNRPGTPPIDALDLACMNHDACSPTGGLPTCDCNARLRDEAAAVSQDPRQAPELRSLASLTAAAATMMLCKPMLNAAAPVAPMPPAAARPVAAATVAQAPAAAAPEAGANAVAAPANIVPETAAPVAAAPEPVIAAPVAVEPMPAVPAPQSRSLP